MKERAGPDDINLSFQLLERALCVKDICFDKLGLQRLSIVEELVSKVEEVESQIRAICLRTVNAIGNESTDVLCEGAAQVKVRLGGFCLQAGQYLRVEIMLTNPEV